MAGRFSVEAVFKAVDRITAPVSRMQNRVGRFTRSMERGLRSVNSALNSVTSGLASAAGAAGKFALVGIGALTAGVTLLMREFSKVENAEAAFTPLMGSAERARELVDALNKTAATTPFQFENLADVANQLLPVMNGNIEKTIKTIRMLGDTSGGSADKLDRVTRGFTKAALKGKVDMESLNMIAEAGVPIFQELAAVMGVKVGTKFFKMISAGKVSTDDLVKSFERMTTTGGIFFRGMEIASKTTTGLWSSMMDEISMTAAALGGILAPTVNELIKGATGLAQRLREWIKLNREWLATRFAEFVEKARVAVLDMVAAVRKLNDEQNLLDRLGVIVTGVSDAFAFLSEHGKTILTVTAAVVGLSLVLNSLVAVLTLVNFVMAANPLGLWITGIALLTVGVVALIDHFGGLNKIAQNVSKWAGDFFSWDSEGSDAATGSGGPRGRGGRRGGPQVVSPQERTARSIEESRTTSTSEVTIKDQTGRAEVTGGKLGAGLTLQRTGAM